MRLNLRRSQLAAQLLLGLRDLLTLKEGVTCGLQIFFGDERNSFFYWREHLRYVALDGPPTVGVCDARETCIWLEGVAGGECLTAG